MLNNRRTLIPLMAGFLLVVSLQLIPFYGYCINIEGTNQSNEMSLSVLSAIGKAVKKDKSVILIDRELPLENNPLPYLLALSDYNYRILSKKAIQQRKIADSLQKLAGRRVIAVMSGKNLDRLPTSLHVRKLSALTCRVTLNPTVSSEQRTIYVVEMIIPKRQAQTYQVLTATVQEK